jgi:rubredoxin
MASNLNFSMCPRCGVGYLSAIGERRGGFSGGKAVAGAILAGPIGLAAGALGKKKVTYQCNRCGYTIEK